MVTLASSASSSSLSIVIVVVVSCMVIPIVAASIAVVSGTIAFSLVLVVAIPLAIIAVIATAITVIISAVVVILAAGAPTLFLLEAHIKKGCDAVQCLSGASSSDLSETLTPGLGHGVKYHVLHFWVTENIMVFGIRD